LVRGKNTRRKKIEKKSIVWYNTTVKQFKWNEEKNIWLMETRGISMKDSMAKMTQKEKQAIQLDEEEIEILEAFEEGKLKKIDMSAAEIEDLKIAARETLLENNRISVRIPERDLKKIKERAQVNGIPYQFLITAVLHQYAEGKISAAL
jgi:predicted DNA binding CopG/RHH family protein